VRTKASDQRPVSYLYGFPKLSAWQEATTAYSSDPSTANCDTYKSTGQAFLESIRSYENCASLYTQSWRDAADEAQADLASIPC
jgi:hypothetical protein